MQIARPFISDWTPRFYVAQDVPENYIEEILEYGCSLLDVKRKLNSYDGLIGDLDHFMILMLSIG